MIERPNITGTKVHLYMAGSETVVKQPENVVKAVCHRKLCA